jgi:hypothetical protein
MKQICCRSGMWAEIWWDWDECRGMCKCVEINYLQQMVNVCESVKMSAAVIESKVSSRMLVGDRRVRNLVASSECV